ncbi:Restriction endonuclease [compost metagenome]
MQTTKKWYQFQEEIAEHFRGLGVSANTNVTIKGVRTSHDIDILVITKFLGVDLKWIIEAKLWKSKVPKEKVFALRTIVDDVGADRGFLISDKGFQRGAVEAAANSNIQLTTFSGLKESTRKFVQSEMLKAYEARADLLAKRYWSHDKRTRIKYGLREDPYDYCLNFSGQLFIGMIFAAIEKAKKNEYPMGVRSMLRLRAGEDRVDNYVELSNWLNLNLNMFDEMLLKAEHAMIINGDFKPSIVDPNDAAAVERERQYDQMMRKHYLSFGEAILLDVPED